MDINKIKKTKNVIQMPLDSAYILKEAKNVFEIEIESLNKIKDELDGNIAKLVELILMCNGRVIFTGMGKSGHIARKISATMASLGTPSFFIHPAEGAHGDLGMITREDILMAISYSGETDEIIQLIPSIKRIGCKLVSLTGNDSNTLDKYADLSINLNIIKEASPDGLAPTTSTTVMLVFGDALAIVLSKLIGFRPDDFAVFHPKGNLGKRLLTTVRDIMHCNEENPVIKLGASIRKVVIEMSYKGLGAISVVDDKGKLVGIVTDGDLRRAIEKYDDVLSLKVEDIMTRNPIITNPDTLVIDALKTMENREKQIMVLPVIDEDNIPIGMIRLHDIIKVGIK